MSDQKHCGNKIVPVVRDGKLICEGCEIGIIEDRKRKSGYRHYIDPGTGKKCKVCNEYKKISAFYVRKNSIDGYRHECKKCMIDRGAVGYDKQKQNGRYKSLWVPTDIWEAMKKVCKYREENMRDFIVRALRAEVERAVGEMRRDAFEFERRKNRAA